MITGPITYRLSRPVTSVEREVVEITLREPTGLDMRSCGDQQELCSFALIFGACTDALFVVGAAIDAAFCRWRR